LLKSCEDISATRKRLVFEIPVDVIEAEIQKGFTEARSKTKLPGFRPGKVPMSIIEKKFGKDIEAEAIERVVPDGYLAAVKDAGFKPMTRPKIENEVAYRKNEPLTVIVSIDVRPVIENLVYENIPITDFPIGVNDDEVERVIKSIASGKGVYEASDEAVDSGDLVIVDFRTDEGIEKKDVVIKIGSGPFPKEFFDAFAGKKKNDEFSAEITFPPDSPSEFAGKTVKFEFVMKEVKKSNIPPIDDELAKDMGLESLEALRAQVKADVLAMRKGEIDRKNQVEILDKLLEAHSFEAPEGLVKAELSKLVAEAKRSGENKKTDEELEKEFGVEAEKSAKIICLIDIIGEKEGVAVSEDEMKQEIYHSAIRYNVKPDELINHYISRDGSLEGIRNAIFDRKTMRLLLEKNKKDKE
jgi:trigger factor